MALKHDLETYHVKWAKVKFKCYHPYGPMPILEMTYNDKSHFYKKVSFLGTNDRFFC